MSSTENEQLMFSANETYLGMIVVHDEKNPEHILEAYDWRDLPQYRSEEKIEPSSLANGELIDGIISLVEGNEKVLSPSHIEKGPLRECHFHLRKHSEIKKDFYQLLFEEPEKSDHYENFQKAVISLFEKHDEEKKTQFWNLIETLQLKLAKVTTYSPSYLLSIHQKFEELRIILQQLKTPMGMIRLNKKLLKNTRQPPELSIHLSYFLENDIHLTEAGISFQKKMFGIFKNAIMSKLHEEISLNSEKIEAINLYLAEYFIEEKSQRTKKQLLKKIKNIGNLLLSLFQALDPSSGLSDKKVHAAIVFIVNTFIPQEEMHQLFYDWLNAKQPLLVKKEILKKLVFSMEHFDRWLEFGWKKSKSFTHDLNRYTVEEEEHPTYLRAIQEVLNEGLSNENNKEKIAKIFHDAPLHISRMMLDCTPQKKCSLFFKQAAPHFTPKIQNLSNRSKKLGALISATILLLEASIYIFSDKILGNIAKELLLEVFLISTPAWLAYVLLSLALALSIGLLCGAIYYAAVSCTEERKKFVMIEEATCHSRENGNLS